MHCGPFPWMVFSHKHHAPSNWVITWLLLLLKTMTNQLGLTLPTTQGARTPIIWHHVMVGSCGMKKTSGMCGSRMKKAICFNQRQRRRPQGLCICILPVMQLNSRWNWVCNIHQATAYVICHTSHRAHNECFHVYFRKSNLLFRRRREFVSEFYQVWLNLEI